MASSVSWESVLAAQSLSIDASHLNTEIVLENKLIFGSVNANRHHFESGVQDLQIIQERWPGLLERMITLRVPLNEFNAGLIDSPGNLKVIIEVA